MSPQDIPGFVWDTQRERYFRVTAPGTTSGSASDTQLLYSSSSLSTRKRTREAQARAQAFHPDNISTRSGRLEHYLLSRTRMLEPCRRLHVGSIGRRPRTEGRAAGPVHQMVYSQASDVLVLADRSQPFELLHQPDGEFQGLYNLEFEREPPQPGSLYMDTTFEGNDLVFTAKRPFEDGTCEIWHMSWAPYDTCDVHFATDIDPKCLSNGAGGDTFVVGGTGGQLFMATLETPEALLQKRWLASESDVLAVYTEPAPNGRSPVFYAGCRSGFVYTLDYRHRHFYRPTLDEMACSRLNHGATTSNVRLVGDHYLLVTGLRDKMALYDMRFPVQALLHYPNYTNDVVISHPFAVNADLNLVALATRQGHAPSIQVFDIFTGGLVETLVTPCTGSAVSSLCWRGSALYSTVGLDQTLYNWEFWRP